MFPAGPTNEVQLRHVYAGPCEEARAESFALRRSLPPPSAESKETDAAASSAHARPKVASSPPYARTRTETRVRRVPNEPCFSYKPSTFGARSSLLPPKDAKPHLALAIGLFRGIPLLPGLLDREPTDGKERTAWCGESRRPAHFLAKITVETSLAIGRIGSPGFHVAVDVMPRSGI